MNGFCAYEATGYVFQRDRNGNRTGKVQQIVHRKGNVQHCPEMYGAIMRQQPDLLQCDSVTFDTWEI